MNFEGAPLSPLNTLSLRSIRAAQSTEGPWSCRSAVWRVRMAGQLGVTCADQQRTEETPPRCCPQDGEPPDPRPGGRAVTEGEGVGVFTVLHVGIKCGSDRGRWALGQVCL